MKNSPDRSQKVENQYAEGSFDPSCVIIFRSEFLARSETFIIEHARSLKEWDVRFFTTKRVSAGLVSQFSVDEIPEPWNARKFHLRGLFSTLKQNFRALSILRQARAKVALVHFGVDAVRIWPFLNILRIPTLVFLHGYDINTNKNWWPEHYSGTLLEVYPQLLLSLSNNKRVGFLACSQAIKEQATKFGIDPVKITVAPLGVDTAIFFPGDLTMACRNHVLFVGRLVEKKGCRYLIDAFSMIQDRFPDSRLRIIGEGELADELGRHAAAVGCRAEFLGYRTPTEISQEMRMARVFCLPSVTASNGDAEGMGIVLLEAQSCGLPVLTSARGGSVEGIIPEITGYSFKEKDVPTLAFLLSKMLGDAALCEEMGAAGRDHILRHRSLEQCSILHSRLLHQHATV